MRAKVICITIQMQLAIDRVQSRAMRIVSSSCRVFFLFHNIPSFFFKYDSFILFLLYMTHCLYTKLPLTH